MRILPMGDRALLVELPALDAVVALHAALAASRPAGVVDLVPAARTVLVRVDPRALALAAARAWIEASADAAASPQTATEPRHVDLEVVYDGADLDETATLVGLTPDALVGRHSGAPWTVAFTGFAPGFGYLISPEWPFDIPRLDSPRTRVPAGSVGLAGGFSGAYPRETPGGWRLIGTTGARLFDPDAESPVLLTPGVTVRFVPVRAAATPARALPDGSQPGDPRESGSSARIRPDSGGSPDSGRGEEPGTSAGREAGGIRIDEAGLLATVQDLGRTGSGALGVAGSGALDRAALRLANRLVGNPEDAAGLEVTMGGLRATALADTWVAVTGAWGSVGLAGRQVDPYRAHEWRAGDELHLDWFAHGARAYVAVRGGLGGRTALGSRATDMMAGLGPAPLRVGDVVPAAGGAMVPIPAADVAPWSGHESATIEVELAPGPRENWFTPDARHTLFDATWTVSGSADRVGIRLEGPELERIRPDELPSEGMVPGALQVPPSGRPTILMADGPVTGGYPVIAVVSDASLDALAQARPGSRIRFRHARPAL